MTFQWFQMSHTKISNYTSNSSQSPKLYSVIICDSLHSNAGLTIPFFNLSFRFIVFYSFKLRHSLFNYSLAFSVIFCGMQVNFVDVCKHTQKNYPLLTGRKLNLYQETLECWWCQTRPSPSVQIWFCNYSNTISGCFERALTQWFIVITGKGCWVDIQKSLLNQGFEWGKAKRF